jgi:hypothetical protein
MTSRIGLDSGQQWTYVWLHRPFCNPNSMCGNDWYNGKRVANVGDMRIVVHEWQDTGNYHMFGMNYFKTFRTLLCVSHRDGIQALLLWDCCMAWLPKADRTGFGYDYNEDESAMIDMCHWKFVNDLPLFFTGFITLGHGLTFGLQVTYYNVVISQCAGWAGSLVYQVKAGCYTRVVCGRYGVSRRMLWVYEEKVLIGQCHW